MEEKEKESLTPIEKLREVAKSEELKSKKSIGELSVNDIEMTLDKNKSYEEQAEDVVSAMATARAVSDEKVAQDLSNKKANELKSKASSKVKQAEAEEINAETDKQEAERKLYEAVLETFGIKKHLPKWLMRIMVFVFTPIYIVLSLAIGIPCGCIKTLIDNIDNIICRYESAADTNKPKIKTTIWVLLILVVLALAALVVLKCFNKI